MALPLTGLVMLLLVACVGRQGPPRSKQLKPDTSSHHHNLNRGRIGSDDSGNDLN